MPERTHADAQDVNPEAGHHAVTGDPRERDAAEAATRRSWRAFPYYPRRYGERGWRFSLSDSGWIATLCDLPPAAGVAQVEWLGGVLAARGMPRYLLERHPGFLHEELRCRVPDEGRRYDVVRAAADALATARRRVLADDAFAAHADAFDARTAALRDAVPRAGAVVVAAVADERGGDATVVARVTEWLCDPARFDQAWIDAAQDTVAAVRGAP
jgi:hypothetical protein